MQRAIITGASSGLGKLIAEELLPFGFNVFNFSIELGIDITDRWQIEGIKDKIDGKIDVLVNCAGVNHLDWFSGFPEAKFDQVMNVNAKGIFTVSQVFLEHLKGGAICNIVSNASHTPMTHSFAYNASKGAAHAMTLQMAHELFKTHGITVFGVSPNKLKQTGMTQSVDARAAELRGITEAEAHAYQLGKLSIGEETDPQMCAEFIAFLLSKKERHKYLNGCIIPYGA